MTTQGLCLPAMLDYLLHPLIEDPRNARTISHKKFQKHVLFSQDFGNFLDIFASSFEMT
jgi:hypothetical protein